MQDPTWLVTEPDLDPHRINHKETVFALGNGYVCTRGTFEEGYPGDWPATIVNGVYDDVPIVYTELANCPDWLPLAIIVEGERFRLDRGRVLSFRRELNLHQATLKRTVRWRSLAGHSLDLEFERFISLAERHVLALRCRLTPLDFEGRVQVQAGLDGYSHNQGVLHWEWLDQGGADDRVWLHVRTRQTAIELGIATRLALKEADDGLVRTCGCQGYPVVEASFQGRPGQTVSLEKIVTLYTGREVETPLPSARDKLETLPDFGRLQTAHQAAWARVWQDCDVLIEGDDTAQRAVRHSLYQLLIAAPRHDDRVSIPAKSLTGFGYRGHVFWDTDIFVVPFFTYTQPEVARNLLTYRYHTLPGARRKAAAEGFEGAMFAWESTDSGDEVTPRWVPGLQGKDLVRIWCGDIELHITADVAYAVWNYWQATGDDAWMSRYGAELVLDTAVFWGGRVEENSQRGRYEIRDVIGPDEYHDHVDNNAFTNRMVQWHLETALEVLAWLRRQDPSRATELEAQLNLTPARLQRWADIVGCMRGLHDPETGLIEQFEGFFDLEELDWGAYEPRVRSIQAILGIEETGRRQVLKQPDVLMLLYLLRDRYDRETLRVNWDYYAPRTDHTYGSSLGPAIHAILACDLGEFDAAYEHFMRAALVDLEDARGNAQEGTHAASAGGVWQALVFGFGGLRQEGETPLATPRLPSHWRRLKFRLQHHGQWYEFDLKASAPTPPFQPAIRGVIFDLDGVLTDTSEFHYLSWKRLADEAGISFDRQANEALRGVSRRESLRRLLAGRRVSEAQAQEMMARKNRYYQASLQDLTPNSLLPGARELLQDLRRTEIKIAIGSASKNARAVLNKLGLEEWVDAISDGYSVERPKPAPDLFLHAAAQLGLPPQRCLVVEDAAAGVEAALAAGMWVVGLGPAERVGAAHLVLTTLEGVCWSDLLTRLTQSKKQTEV